MSVSDSPVPLSAVALRLTDEVGQAVLDRVAAGDLAGAAELDQHVAVVRAEIALCRADHPSAARLAGEKAARAGWPRPARPHHARRRSPAHGSAAHGTAAHGTAAQGSAPAAAPASAGTVTAACPDVPFADNPWQADAPLAVGLLLHYACGFVEAAVLADWWPANPAVGHPVEWQALRLAAVCRLVRSAEASAAQHPDLR